MEEKSGREKKRNKVKRKRLQDEWLTELIVRFGSLPKLNATGLVHMARYPRNTSRRSRITVDERYQAVLLGRLRERERDQNLWRCTTPTRSNQTKTGAGGNTGNVNRQRTPSLEPWLESALELELVAACLQRGGPCTGT